MTDVVCCIAHYKFEGTRVHYDVTTFCYVCETANRLRLLFITSTLRSGDMEEGGWVVVDSEYHHHHELWQEEFKTGSVIVEYLLNLIAQNRKKK